MTTAMEFVVSGSIVCQTRLTAEVMGIVISGRLNSFSGLCRHLLMTIKSEYYMGIGWVMTF
ncbi:MAG: hypothetical protein ABIK68_22100 [bacterium]